MPFYPFELFSRSFRTQKTDCVACLTLRRKRWLRTHKPVFGLKPQKGDAHRMVFLLKHVAGLRNTMQFHLFWWVFGPIPGYETRSGVLEHCVGPTGSRTRAAHTAHVGLLRSSTPGGLPKKKPPPNFCAAGSTVRFFDSALPDLFPLRNLPLLGGCSVGVILPQMGRIGCTWAAYGLYIGLDGLDVTGCDRARLGRNGLGAKRYRRDLKKKTV